MPPFSGVDYFQIQALPREDATIHTKICYFHTERMEESVGLVHVRHLYESDFPNRSLLPGAAPLHRAA
jgi:hypothetical protein